MHASRSPLGWFLVCSILLIATGCRRTTPIEQLNQSILAGDTSAVKKLLQEHPGIVNNHGTHLTPLECAAIAGNSEIAKLLLDHGADPNARDQINDMHPVAHAVRKGNLPLLKLLVDHGGRVTDVGLM